MDGVRDSRSEVHRMGRVLIEEVGRRWDLGEAEIPVAPVARRWLFDGFSGDI